MEVKTLQETFFQILAAELRGTGLDEATAAALNADPSALSALCDLSHRHDLAHVVAAALQRAGVSVPDEVQAKFRKADFLSVYRLEQMKYAFAQICETLEAAEIPYLPLKGSVIRPYYPDERMRTSCDIDILVREETLDAAVHSLEAIGYVFEHRAYHDVSLHSPEGIHLELHYSLLRNIDRLDLVLSCAWDYAVPTEGFRYEMTSAFFAFHHMAHMSAHFLNGGCGVRALMDIWVMQHRMCIDFSEADELLDKADLRPFATEMLRLAEVCLDGASGDEFTDTLLGYILTGGIYGTMTNNVTMQTQRSGGTFRYVMGRLFPPYKFMKERYPILKKVPIFLPFGWIVRAFSVVFSRRTRRALNEVQTARSMTEEQANALQMMQERLHL